jgi:ABC-2 type transport system permease protein
MRYLRLWRRFFLAGVMRQLEYRANTLLMVVGRLGEQAVLLVMYLVFYRFTDEVAGWSSGEALLLLGVFWIYEGVWAGLIGCNLRLVAEYIQDGRLDQLLLRPVSAQFLVSCIVVEWWELTTSATGLVVVIYAGQRVGVTWSPASVAAALAFAVSGLGVIYALRFAIAACTFWVTRVSELYSLLNSVQAVARFPVHYFQRPVRDVLTYVIPIAFATTFPAQALLGEADLRLLPVGGALAAAALFASSRFWRYPPALA